MSVADKMSQAYVQGADDAKAQMAEEIASLKSEIASMQKDRDEARRDATGWQVAAEAYKDEIKRWQNS